MRDGTPKRPRPPRKAATELDPGERVNPPSLPGDDIARWELRALALEADQIATVCLWCMARPIDRELGDSCAGCRGIGSGDVRSPSGGAR